MWFCCEVEPLRDIFACGPLTDSAALMLCVFDGVDLASISVMKLSVDKFWMNF
jgi:hypothetical protein